MVIFAALAIEAAEFTYTASARNDATEIVNGACTAAAVA